MLTLEEVLLDFRAYAGLGDDVDVGVQSTSASGQRALHWMAILGDCAGIRLLVAAGAEVDPVDAGGNTPLHEAVAGRQVEAAKALIEAGASPGRANHRGLTALDIAAADAYRPMLDPLMAAGS